MARSIDRCHWIRIHDDLAIGISGGASDGLDQRGFTAQEALLVRIQDRHQRYLGNIQALPQQVDAHQHIEFAQAQIPDQLHTLNGVHIVVHIPDTHAEVFQIGGEILRHLLGEGGHQHPLAHCHPGD